jgi:hypothetical protein
VWDLLNNVPLPTENRHSVTALLAGVRGLSTVALTPQIVLVFESIIARKVQNKDAEIREMFLATERCGLASIVMRASVACRELPGVPKDVPTVNYPKNISDNVLWQYDREHGT